jgi:hypothetical protein
VNCQCCVHCLWIVQPHLGPDQEDTTLTQTGLKSHPNACDTCVPTLSFRALKSYWQAPTKSGPSFKSWGLSSASPGTLTWESCFKNRGDIHLRPQGHNPGRAVLNRGDFHLRPQGHWPGRAVFKSWGLSPASPGTLTWENCFHAPSLASQLLSPDVSRCDAAGPCRLRPPCELRKLWCCRSALSATPDYRGWAWCASFETRSGSELAFTE